MALANFLQTYNLTRNYCDEVNSQDCSTQNFWYQNKVCTLHLMQQQDDGLSTQIQLATRQEKSVKCISYI